MVSTVPMSKMMVPNRAITLFSARMALRNSSRKSHRRLAMLEAKNLLNATSKASVVLEPATHRAHPPRQHLLSRPPPLIHRSPHQPAHLPFSSMRIAMAGRIRQTGLLDRQIIVRCAFCGMHSAGKISTPCLACWQFSRTIRVERGLTT